MRDNARYTVLGECGRGGIGIVEEAYDEALDRAVALKQLREPSRAAEARFLREAKITARLEHPSIVPVHDVGRWADGTPFYSMKVISGRTLKELLAGAKDRSARLRLTPHVLAVADAVSYAHAKRIIHRDLKPSNIIVGRAMAPDPAHRYPSAKELADDLKRYRDGRRVPQPTALAARRH